MTRSTPELVWQSIRQEESNKGEARQSLPEKSLVSLDVDGGGASATRVPWTRGGYLPRSPASGIQIDRRFAGRKPDHGRNAAAADSPSQRAISGDFSRRRSCVD